MKCSCPPFECMCSAMLGQQQAMQQSCYEGIPWNTATPHDPYHTPSHPEDLYHPCDFPRDLPPLGDVFQPDEIFQLDQPLRADTELPQERTLLDLNSSTCSFSTTSDLLFSCDVERTASFPPDLLALPDDVKPFPPQTNDFCEPPYHPVECPPNQRYYPSKSEPLYVIENLQPLDPEGFFQQPPTMYSNPQPQYHM